MTLGLRYRINEGINVTEDLGDGHQKSIDVIVRDIVLFPECVNVDFELRNLNGNSELKSLSEDERYDVTPLCTLHLPRNPLGLSRYTLRKILPRYPLTRKSLPRKDKVILKFYATRAVEFSKRKRYD